MLGSDSNLRQMMFLITRPTFLVLDIIGILIMVLVFFIPQSVNDTVLLTAGSTFLTMGLTLPIALYYQNRFNFESFELLKACDESGIKAVFVSRQHDSPNLRNSIEQAAQTTSGELFLLGVCFRTLFDPNVAHTYHVLARLNNPHTLLRVMVLDPDSKAAQRRAAIEIGGATMDDINTTLHRGIVSTIQTRITYLIKNTEDFINIANLYLSSNGDEKEKSLRKIAELINLHIHVYSDVDPIMFIIGFEESLFAEQYHFGRVEDIVPFGGCIGKYVPVIQYESKSTAYKFFRHHFDYVWQEYSRDITFDIVDEALSNFPLRQSTTV